MLRKRMPETHEQPLRLDQQSDDDVRQPKDSTQFGGGLVERAARPAPYLSRWDLYWTMMLLDS